MIKSPYNFVPAPSEQEVFIPDWADQVSHDIPFSDGESGEIQLTITAHTPIFIRDGHSKGNETNQFSHIDGTDQYFIPATSIKGMVRNVMEIMSKSRMIQVDNNHHTIRQIMKPKSVLADEGYELTGVEKKKIKAGWVLKKENDYYLVDCGEPLKIRYTDIDKILTTNFGENFGEKALTDLSNFDNKTGAYKYLKIIGTKSLEHTFELHPLDENDKQSSWISKFQHLKYVRQHNSNDSEIDSFSGTIVCTGQATDYITNKTARKGEYVFIGKKSELLKSVKAIKLSAEVIETFKFINRNNQPDELKDWTYWKEKDKEGIPVFFRWDKEGETIIDMGLTFMYKTPTKYDVHDLLPYEMENGKCKTKTLDLAETIFGTVRSNNLKGRIFISNANALSAVELCEVTAALSNPKSSFYPNYLKQEGVAGRTIKFNTYNSKSSLPGYKRYPVKRTIIDNQGTGDMSTTFKPLDIGAHFVCKIRFHNLRKVEIGALMSALTFHNSESNLFHSIGMGKPLGYGAIRINLLRYSGLNHTLEEYMHSFELEMKLKDPDWGNDKFLKELFQMASFQSDIVESNLSYPELKDFQTYKNIGKYLQDYSVISNNEIRFNTLVSRAEYQNEFDIRNEKDIKAKELRSKWDRNLQEINNNKTEDSISAFLSDCPFDELKVGLDKDLIEIINNNILSSDKEIAYKLNTISAYENFLVRHPNSNFDEEIRRQLNICRAIGNANVSLNFNSYNFEDIKKVLKIFINYKQFSFSEAQKIQIITALKSSWTHENKNPKKSVFIKQNKFVRLNNFPWTDIVKWIGEENTKRLYSELTE